MPAIKGANTAVSFLILAQGLGKAVAEFMKRRVTDPAELRELNQTLAQALALYLKQFDATLSGSPELARYLTLVTATTSTAGASGIKEKSHYGNYRHR